METEYEAMFENIDKDTIRKKLDEIGAELFKKEFLMKRSVFYLPKNDNMASEWLRVRDEGDKKTLSLKRLCGGKIEDQKEICLEIDDLEKAGDFLINIGCRKGAYQESRREIWKLKEVEICIDEWPFLEPFIEIEGKSEEDVREVAEKLGFNWEEAIFDSADYLYNKKYGLSRENFCEDFPKLSFDENPFKNFKLV